MNGVRRPRARTDSGRRKRTRVAQLLPASKLLFLINNSRHRESLANMLAKRTPPSRRPTITEQLLRSLHANKIYNRLYQNSFQSVTLGVV